MTAALAQPIAIVGLAAALPGAGSDLDAFAEMLEHREDRVGPVPESRARDGGRAPDVALAECALLERIDAFDARFFGMSLREARQMDPQQRFLLTLACEAIWDAGRALSALRGSRTAVILGEAAEDYAPLLAREEAPMVSGLLTAAQAGRIAHELDLRGPAQCLNTACSSSLAAILEAVRRLQRGEADWALAGGVRLFPRPPLATIPGNEGILSARGRARSFDAGADGTGLGEGGALFLLRPLAAAQADGDPIRAVVLGGATNQDGGRSNGFAAPSQVAQAELLRAAWASAGVNPATIGLIEAHGTGTKLGDPIEYKGLDDAFGRGGARAGFCALSSLKSNIGHLDSAAGAASLTKLVVALERGRRYASAHFETPNPLLETEGSALVLSSETLPWPSVGPRRGGVSAFGITGTNVHLVLEEAPADDAPATAEAGLPLLVPVSATSEAALRRHAARLADHLAAGRVALADLAFVQATGRDHGPFRAAFVAADAAEAVAALRAIADGAGGGAIPGESAPTFLLGHECPLDAARASAWTAAFPALGEVPGAGHPLHGGLVVMRALAAAGLSTRSMIGHGVGNAVLDAVKTGAALPATTPAPTPLDPGRLARALESLSIQGTLALVVPWDGTLAQSTAAALEPRMGTLVRLDTAREPRRALLDLVGALYRAGVPIAWETLARFVGGYGRRVSVPTALFDPVRCWVEQPVVAAAAVPAPAAPEAPEPDAPADDDVETVLAAIWRELLGAETISADDDFFDLGGDSLMQVQLENAVRARLGLPIAFDDVLDHPTLGALAAVLNARRGPAEPDEAQWLAEADGSAVERGLAAIWCRLLGASAVSRNDDFFDLGGDSLMHVQLENAVRERFGLALTVDDLYDNPTIAALAGLVEAARGDALPEAVEPEGPRAEPGRDRAPATHSQRRMWMLQEMAPDSGAYNVTATFRLSGRVDATALAGALERLAARHAILRSRFVLEDGRLVIRAEDQPGPALEVDEAAGTPETRLAAHAARPFDLGAVGAWRAVLIPGAGAEGGFFQLVLHHAICDEWSLDLLLREIAADYAGRAVAAPALQFHDWAAFEAAQDASAGMAADREYWRRRLAGVAPDLPLPTDFPHDGRQDHEGAWLALAIPAEEVAAMRAAARQAGGTLFAWLLTGYVAWISRVSQATDLVVGVPVAGRSHAAAERIPGCFINTLPLRIDTAGASFRTLFERVRGALSEAMAHARYPFDRMVEDLGVAGDASRPPLVQTLLSLQGGGPAGREPFRLGETAATPVQLQDQVSWLDLSAVLWEDAEGGLEGIFAYRTGLFEEATVRSFWRQWTDLLQAGLATPDEPIETLMQEEAW
ncbi:condensation domain-containing protein [Salinarimonas chemoclinalis]|uniref:condensation domain-containing protein n=1 Tax=Salinarimonas chemoclinalis TaxID=3241599 RepID=UPI0035574932